MFYVVVPFACLDHITNGLILSVYVTRPAMPQVRVQSVMSAMNKAFPTTRSVSPIQAV